MYLYIRPQATTIVNNQLCGNPLIDINAHIKISSPYGILYNGLLSNVIPFSTGIVEDVNGVCHNVEYSKMNIAGHINFGLQIFMKNSWDCVPLKIEVSLSGYRTYINTFKIYNYDMGDGAITNGIDFHIILTQPYVTVGTQNRKMPYSSIIAYRVPLLDKILIYKSNSSPGTTQYSIGNTSKTGINSYYCDNKKGCSIAQLTTTEYGSCLATLDVPEVKWLPDYELEVSCVGDCQNICTSSIIQENKASVNLDFNLVSLFSIDGILNRCIYNTLGINYELRDYTNTIVQEHTTSFINFSSGISNPYFSNLYSFNFTTPDVGDYVITSKIQVIGEISNLIKGGIPELNKYYMILNNRDADFTVCGALLNDVYEVFQATGALPIWGNGVLIEIIDFTDLTLDNLINSKHYYIYDTNMLDFTLCSTPSNDGNYGVIFTSNDNEPTGVWNDDIVYEVHSIYECIDSEVISSCHWYRVTQVECNSYKIENLSMSNITVDLYQMTSLGVFEATGISYRIASLSSTTVTHSTDGIYQYIVNDGSVDFIYIPVVFCNLRDCIIKKIKDLSCTQAPACKDKEWYMYNSLLGQALTVFNLLNSLYNFNFIFEVISPNMLSDLYELQQLLDRLEEYCDEPCHNPCNCS